MKRSCWGMGQKIGMGVMGLGVCGSTWRSIINPRISNVGDALTLVGVKPIMIESRVHDVEIPIHLACSSSFSFSSN